MANKETAQGIRRGGIRLTKVLIVGDVHENFGRLNKLINKREPKIVIACGDFGFWDIEELSKIKPQGAKIYACDGNHENFELLQELRKRVNNRCCPIEVVPDVYYLPRGTILHLNGFTMLFMGGAESHDKEYRTKGIDWFPEESITKEDINRIPFGRIDVVISHCAPDFVRGAMGYSATYSGDSPILLGYVFEEYVPDLWYFGHYHAEYRSLLHGCQFHGLNYLGQNGSWSWLPENNGG